eukprot:TRINITY_DN46280_c0_g1_i1.p1 TRINITY_DN46280_c0_g1~~TRINITY_DN46280_c0_g1_i1.p1  ORF type:complete len:616 (-),score=121.56 TRINITY_DN46280_c0_g1_i1:206-2053(-)
MSGAAMPGAVPDAAATSSLPHRPTSRPRSPDDGDVAAAAAQRERIFSEAARRRSMRVPKEGMMISITSVMDVYQHVRMLVGMFTNVWGWSLQTVTCFLQADGGLLRVHTGVGQENFVMQAFYLQGQDLVKDSPRAKNSRGCKQQKAPHLDKVKDVTLKHPTRYFADIKLLLKMRWLLRLHSAGCELDYKVCSLKNLFLGLQYVVLQQSAEVEADSIFDTKVAQSAGAFINLESVVDDLVDQLQRALGTAYKPFQEFVATCDPAQSMHVSKMDSTITPPAIQSNDQLAVIVDTIFLTCFLRKPCKEQCSKLRELYADLAMFGISLPDVPPLRAAQHLRTWAKALSKPTRADREKGLGKEQEKLAQLDAVLLAAAVELRMPEVMAPPEEWAKDVMNTRSSGNASSLTEDIDFGSTGRVPGSAGPSASRVVNEQKPQLTRSLFEAALMCIHHHATFPEGIRERLYSLLNEEWGLTAENAQSLAVAATQNIDGNKLPASTLLSMDHREKTRLREYAVNTWKDTSHLIVPSLIAVPSQEGKPPKFTQSAPPAPRLPFASAFTSSDMTRSLPDFRGFTAKSHGREPFKVPQITGPLTMDPDLRKLRTTGFFWKMPPLKGGP